MLSVYTRHSRKCLHKNNIAWRRCRCPKWIQGTPSEDHDFIRTSAGTRTWEQAEDKGRKLEASARPSAPKTATAVTIAEAVHAYRADETARCLSKSTIRQSKTLFEMHLLAWAKDVGLTLLRKLTTPQLVKFRATWGNGPNTTRRKHERLTGFFEFCISKGWQRALRRLFQRAKIKKPDGTPKRCHPHMFRDTFAVELLLAGVPIDQVSLLLGHSSVKVTERHYAPFVKARQEQLERSVKLSWQTHVEWLAQNDHFAIN